MTFLQSNFILLNSRIPHKRASNKSILPVLTENLRNELWKERMRNSYFRLRVFVIICFDFSVNLEIIYSRVSNNRPPSLYIFLNFPTTTFNLIQPSPSIFNFVISKILSQNFNSISIKTYAKFLHKIKMLIKKF